jgi:hypothetical protein
MTLNIQDDAITSNRTSHTARLLPGDQALWEVSWLPGQAMNRNHAVAAMTLADLTRAEERADHLQPDLIDRTAEFLPSYDISSYPLSPSAEPEPGKSGQLSDPEAGG